MLLNSVVNPSVCCFMASSTSGCDLACEGHVSVESVLLQENVGDQVQSLLGSTLSEGQFQRCSTACIGYQLVFSPCEVFGSLTRKQF